MGGLIFLVATFCMVVVVSSCFELYSTNLDVSIRASKFKCFEEGRFHHPEECGAYVECVRSREGTFKRRFGSCHGSVFSEELRHCVEPDEASGCKASSRKTRAIVADERFNSLCSSVRNGFVCADCKTAVNCVEGVPFTDNCGGGDTCDEREEFGGAVCYPGQPQTCSCNDDEAFRVDSYNPQMFFYCNEIGAEPDIYHCPDDRKFDTETDQCTNDLGLPVCKEMGDFALHNNCSQYYTCIYSKTGWVQKQFACDNGLMFNEGTGNCEDPCNWDTGAFECQLEGRYPDPLSCNHFYECVLYGQGFRQYRRQCPSGTVWDKTAMNGKGHCITDSAGTCKPVSVTKCHIPEGRCTDNPVPPVSPAPPAPPVPTGTNELENQIVQLREEKILVEKVIEDAKFATEALLETAGALAELHSTLIQPSRRETGIQAQINLITMDASGQMNISPYCAPNDVNSLTGTPSQVLEQVLSDLRKYVASHPDYVPCMNNVIKNLTAVLYEDLSIVNDLVSAAASVVTTLEFASDTFKTMEMNLMQAQEKHTQILSSLKVLETQLTSGDLVTESSTVVPAGLIINRFTSFPYRNTPTRTKVAVRTTPVQNRWYVLSRGNRRARSINPSN